MTANEYNRRSEGIAVSIKSRILAYERGEMGLNKLLDMIAGFIILKEELDEQAKLENYTTQKGDL